MATTMLDKISGIALDADRQQKNNKVLDVKCVCDKKAALKQQNGKEHIFLSFTLQTRLRNNNPAHLKGVVQNGNEKAL